jgi:hypothetical protein
MGEAALVAFSGWEVWKCGEDTKRNELLSGGLRLGNVVGRRNGIGWRSH